MTLKSRTSSILMPIQRYFVYGDGSCSGWGERERLKGKGKGLFFRVDSLTEKNSTPSTPMALREKPAVSPAGLSRYRDNILFAQAVKVPYQCIVIFPFEILRIP